MPARQITSHKVPGLNDQIEIEALDEPGEGGANHLYEVTHPGSDPHFRRYQHVKFQKGPVGEQGANGISNEALLAIVRDRLEGFQRGPFHCFGNALALTHIIEAMKALHQRTADRINRGVEGTSAI